MELLPFLANAGSAGDIHPALILPFGLLLLLIAVMPLTSARLKHLWERYHPHAALALAALVGAFYLVRMPDGAATLGHTAHEYFSFIALVGSLFVVAGGIHLRVKGEATPRDNVVLLLVGAVLANFIGTTGASMVLIRPYIRMNKVRIGAYHVVFFIFIVSNCGGALTPIGDPPLFLGYLRGVPFFWLIEHVVWIWLAVIGALLAIFYAYDRRAFGRAPKRIQAGIAAPDTFRIEGGVNVLFLLAVVGAVFLPERFFLREIVMLAAAAGSYFSTPKSVHAANEFGFGPIREVAFLFVGIFVTMMPALGYLEAHGREFGFERPMQYYTSTGALSAVLDNAPTYVNFLKLAEVGAAAGHPEAFAAAGTDERAVMRELLAREPALVVAVSLGAVFFGAMTYIGNGPNFMVKAIADAAGVRTPSFFGYILRFSLPVLLPVLLLAGWIFL
jgi:Na+/H+ antiporter NhaD/arsenite permease-like protein